MHPPRTYTRLLLTLVALLATAALQGAAPRFSVVPPRTVYEGDRFAVTYRLENGEGTSLQVSDINGCTKLYGPSTSSSRSFSVVNGRTESSSRYEYTYTYRADRAGEFTIPEASIVVDGKRLTTQPARFTVQPATARGTAPGRRPTTIDNVDTQQSGRQIGADDVFVRIILSRSSVYEQEPIECTIKLYTTYNISAFMPTVQPAFDGFLIQELDNQAQLNREEQLNGRTYLTAVLKRCLIFPQKSGTLTINSGNYDITVVQYENISMGGIMTVRQPVEKQIKVNSNSARVQVKPLPQPQPEGFSGAVGTFEASTRLVGNTFRTNDAATLIYLISGTGNIRYLKEPVVDFPDEFEQYTPKSDVQTHVIGSNVTGTMTVEYTFVPQTTGDFRIGAGRFVYFDPQAAQYRTINTPQYDIKVVKGAETAVSKDQEAISAKNTDIRHILAGTDATLRRDTTPIVDRWWYPVVYILILAALAVTLLLLARHARREGDVQGMRLARARKVARQRLREADAKLRARDADGFYEATHRALQGYLSDKLQLPLSQLSSESIDERLAERGAPDDLRRRVLDTLEQCQMARYTPGSGERTDEVYRAAGDIINDIENLKRPAR